MVSCDILACATNDFLSLVFTIINYIIITFSKDGDLILDGHMVNTMVIEEEFLGGKSLSEKHANS